MKKMSRHFFLHCRNPVALHDLIYVRTNVLCHYWKEIIFVMSGEGELWIVFACFFIFFLFFINIL